MLSLSVPYLSPIKAPYNKTLVPLDSFINFIFLANKKAGALLLTAS